MIIPEYGRLFLRDALAAGTHEALLCLGRKNAKSAIVAVLVLAYLAGPLKRAGWRSGVCSISREKAHELRAQIQMIATASGLKGLRFWRARTSPAIVSEAGVAWISSLPIKTLALRVHTTWRLLTELGLLSERNRALVNSMRSSVSAKGGTFLSLSVHGDGPFIPEI